MHLERGRVLMPKGGKFGSNVTWVDHEEIRHNGWFGTPGTPEFSRNMEVLIDGEWLPVRVATQVEREEFYLETATGYIWILRG